MPNQLIGEQSPYLLQHAHNPVDWLPWGGEAFAKAKQDNKPVIVSIGYSACHWCHVMEKESFEDPRIAEFMNRHFVCIKVDREEHPDVDHMYMDAVQAISGNGGWPLNVFVTPDRAPFYGGTYYPPRPAYSRPSWMQLLQRMADIWENRREEVNEQAGLLLQHLRQASQAAASVKDQAPDWALCRNIADNLLKQADTEKGGFGNAPKFPGSMAIGFLLEHYHFTGYEPALKHALKCLDAMMEGGIYDQAGGGFARYATDRDWLVPHFEKMLYDNALLAAVYCDAYVVTRDEKYRRVAEETLAFCDRELRDKWGGYYCALDADSEGEEGRFYTWSWDEWIEALGENDRAVMEYFGVRPEGNWEGANILHIGSQLDEVAGKYRITPDALNSRIKESVRKLLIFRDKKVRPGTDDKCLLSWNAMMNACLSKAAVTLGEHGKKYAVLAGSHMEWMLEAYAAGADLLHTWKNGAARIPAKLDDYAFLVQALLRLPEATGDNKWINKAISITERVIEVFGGAGQFFYYTPAGQTDIPVRKVELYDGATPSANSVMAWNLKTCGMLAERTDWMELADAMLRQMSDTVLRHGYSYGNWATFLQRQVAGYKTIVCSGENSLPDARALRQHFMPQAVITTLKKEIYEIPIFESKYFDGKSFIFVCSENECLSPVNSVEQALQLIKQ